MKGVYKVSVGYFLILLMALLLMPGAETLGAKKKILIGVLNPMSGRVSRLDPYSIGAVKLAIKEINEKGGINIKGKSYKLDYKEYDTSVMTSLTKKSFTTSITL